MVGTKPNTSTTMQVRTTTSRVISTALSRPGKDGMSSTPFTDQLPGVLPFQGEPDHRQQRQPEEKTENRAKTT